jgi:hypothetical protein
MLVMTPALLILYKEENLKVGEETKSVIHDHDQLSSTSESVTSL